MNRNNEIVRKSNILQWWRVVRRWACKENDLSQGDMEFLIYLEPIDYFTMDDFKTGTFMLNWNNNRFWRMTKQGWITRIKKGRNERSRYVVSQKGKRLINRIYRILLREEPLPEGVASNKTMKREGFADKMYSQLIKKFNRDET